MLPLVVGAAVLVGLWFYRTARTPSYCVHRLEEMDLVHPALLDCDVALSARVFVRKAWQALNPYFPDQKGQRFTLTIFFNKNDRRPGFQQGRDVSFNLAQLKREEGYILDTLVEEIHHLREGMAGIKSEFVSPQPKGLLAHEDIVKYYALNPHEHRALKAAVEIVGTRAQLFKEVEEYRALHGIA